MTEGRGGDRAALATVRALAHAGIDVVVAYSSPPSLASVSRYIGGRIPLPEPESEAFEHRVREVAGSDGFEAVFPTSDTMLQVLVPQVAPLVDKHQMTEAARSVGLDTPESTYLGSGSELWGRRHSLQFPFVVKPVLKQAMRPTRLVRSEADLFDGDVGGPLLVQPYLSGRMSAVSGVIWDEELVVAMQQRYIRTWPIDCGTASYAQVEQLAPELAEKVRRLLGGHQGIFQAQFAEGRLIDLNPRPYGSMPLATAAGVNYPQVVCSLSRGEKPRVGSPRVGTTYRWWEGDVRSILGSHRDWGELARRADAYSVVSWRDPRPAVTRGLYALSGVRKRSSDG